MTQDILSIKSPYAKILPMNKEYDTVEQIFQKSIGKENFCISSVFKIENPDMTNLFDKRVAFITQLRNKSPEIINVFHGTTLDAAKNIIETGFNTSYSSIAAYGKGTYASPYVTTAMVYCKDVYCDKKFSMIFLCRFIKGVFGYAQNGGMIDTTKYDYSGNKSNIYVTPYNEGIIPDYLICYCSWAK